MAKGQKRSSREIRLAGKFALVVGALASLVAVGTGLLAMFRMGIAIEGAMLNHLVSGAASALLGLVVAIWRSKKEVVGFAYLTVLLLSGVLMALAGHLGAEMVWG